MLTCSVLLDFYCSVGHPLSLFVTARNLGTHAVLDIHKAWCGPCDAVTPTYDRAALEYEDWENRVRFFSVGAAPPSLPFGSSLPCVMLGT